MFASVKSKESKNTLTEKLPDGAVLVKTTSTVQTTTADGRTVTEKVTTVKESSGSDVRAAREEGGRFKLPAFFRSAGKAEPLADGRGQPLSLAEFRGELLRQHNVKRAEHGAGQLAVSDELNALAQDWAQHLARLRSLQHRPNSGYGENVFTGYSSGDQISPGRVVDSWYSEVKQYNYNGQSTNCGHFTQLVWKGSKEVGFGRATSEDGSVYVVANYAPPGNVIGQFKENVERPQRR